MFLEDIKFNGFNSRCEKILESWFLREECSFGSTGLYKFLVDGLKSVFMKWNNRVTVFLKKRKKTFIKLRIGSVGDVEEFSGLGYFFLYSFINVIEY